MQYRVVANLTCSPYYGAKRSVMIGYYTVVLHTLQYATTMHVMIRNNYQHLYDDHPIFSSMDMPSPSACVGITMFGLCISILEVDFLLSLYCRTLVYAILHYVVLCYAMLCYVMLYCAMLSNTNKLGQP